MAFTKKSIRVVLAKDKETFLNGKNAIDFRGMPVDIQLDLAGLYTVAKVRIYGVSKEHLDEITSLPNIDPLHYISEFYIRVYIDEGFGEEELFTGTIRSAIPNYNSSPDIYIEINSYAGTFSNLMDGIPPTSFDGDVPAPELFKKLCNDYGVKFVNHGVEKVCNGSPRYDQIGLMNRLRQASKDYGIFTEIYNDEVHIWENENKVWKISKADYVGYPTFTQTGISVVLDKAVRIRRSDSFILSGSEIDAANGRWHVNTVKYALSTRIGGNWQVAVTGYRERVSNE